MPTSRYYRPFALRGIPLTVALLLPSLLNAQNHAPWLESRRIPSNYAIQASATHKSHVFAIASRVIGKYDRTTGELLAASTGDAVHLNSGLVWKGSMLCAHSNYPGIPEQSTIMQLDIKSMEVCPWHEFGDYGGSLTWIVRRNRKWLCNFAKYEDKNNETFLVEFDNRFNELRRWTYPEELIAKLGKYSHSGGIWYQNHVRVMGHDLGEIYYLKIPRRGTELEYVGMATAPFTGQGFAVDSQTGRLVGISRAERQVIFAKQ